MGRGDDWLSLHYILGCEACQLHFCTLRLYFKHHFIYIYIITGPHIRVFVFYIVMLKHFGVFVLVIIKIS